MSNKLIEAVAGLIAKDVHYKGAYADSISEAAGASKGEEEKFHMSLDKLVHKTFGHSPAEKKEKVKKEEVEMNEEEAKKPLYHFQQTIASILKKHPDANERNKLANYHADAMKKSDPKFDHEGFLKAAGVMKEEVEEIEENAKETSQKALSLADKLRKKDPEKSKMYRNLGIKAMQRSNNPTGVKAGQPHGSGNKALRKQGIEPVPSPWSSSKMRGYFEEVEELDELSKDTLTSYRDKAVASQGKAYDEKMKAGRSGDFDTAHKYSAITNKRGFGLGRLDRRGVKPFGPMTKEEVEELDELSKKTLSSYVDKADDSVRKLARTTLVGANPKQKESIRAKIDKKIDKRLDAMTNAVKKMTMKKEEVEELDELKKSTLQSYAGKVVDKTRTMPQGAKKQKHLAGFSRAMEKMSEK